MADKLARAKLARAAARFHAQTGAASLPPLILMTDDARLADPIAAARALPRGSMVILRARQSARRIELAKALHPIVRACGLKLLVASDPDLAANIGAHGIHLPAIRAKEAAHWRALHPRWIVTVAAHTLNATCGITHADAILLSPIFATQSHPGGAVLGGIKLRIFARRSRLPVYALGGLDAHTVRSLEGAKLAGIAAIGALAV